MQTTILVSLALTSLLIGNLSILQPDGQKGVGVIHFQSFGTPLKGTGPGEHPDRHGLDEVAYVDNSEPLNISEPKNDPFELLGVARAQRELWARGKKKGLIEVAPVHLPQNPPGDCNHYGWPVATMTGSMPFMMPLLWVAAR